MMRWREKMKQKKYLYFLNFSLILVLIMKFSFAGVRIDEKISITVDDYRLAKSLLPENLKKKVFYLEVRPNWVKNSAKFWYKTNTRKGERFFVVDPEKKFKREAFDHERLLKALKEKTGREYSIWSIPFRTIKFIDEKTIEFEIKDKIWVLDLNTYRLTPKEKKEKKLEKLSPDEKWKAFTKNYNLFIRSKEGKKIIQLSRDGIENYEYASYLGWDDLIEGECGERPKRFWVEWSPDSKKIFTQIVDLKNAKKMYLLQSVNKTFRSKLFSYYRAIPGEKDLVYYIPVIFDIENKKEIKIKIEPVPYFIGFDVQWNKNSTKLYMAKFDRGYKGVNIYEIDAKTGEAKVLVRDENKTYVDTALFDYRILEKSGNILITSERDGWNHIYLFDLKTGKLKNQVTKGKYVVLKIIHVDEDKQQIYFIACGREKDEDPYLVHLYKVNFDGSELVNLTPERAYHEIYVSPDKKYFVDNISRVDLPTRSFLRVLESGKTVMKLGEADIQELLKIGWKYPEPFKAKAQDGITDIYGLIWRPIKFDPSKKYPVIDHSYTGPQAVNTPKTFKDALFHPNTSLAQLQFICITLDGRGTARRSKKFHNYSYKNLGGGCFDHIKAIKDLAKKYTYMDIERVGIYGHSAGGYDTVHALLMWPDFYKVGVASSGNHDHRMAKAWWPEQYMGYPVGKYYNEQSNITLAKNLKGKLLLVHGEMDENVNPVATLRLVDALIKNNKDFDLLILPNTHHGYKGIYKDYFIKKRWAYFIKHLHGLNVSVEDF